MLTREEIRTLALEAKDRLHLTWPQVGKAIGRSPVYAAMLVYGYGQATPEEAKVSRVRSTAKKVHPLHALDTAAHLRSAHVLQLQS